MADRRHSRIQRDERSERDVVWLLRVEDDALGARYCWVGLRLIPEATTSTHRDYLLDEIGRRLQAQHCPHLLAEIDAYLVSL